MLFFNACTRKWVYTEKDIDNIFIIEGISFETAHGKLNLRPRQKISFFPAYLQSEEYSNIFSFLRLNYVFQPKLISGLPSLQEKMRA